MSDLIDRQELKERLMYMARFRCNSEIGEPRCGLTRSTVFHMSEIMKVVIDMPTIEERKTGRWIYGEDEYGIDGYHCDKCGFFVPWDYTHTFINYIEDYNFCPSCGADMRGGDAK